jgi:hypothetical protein
LKRCAFSAGVVAGTREGAGWPGAAVESSLIGKLRPWPAVDRQLAGAQGVQLRGRLLMVAPQRDNESFMIWTEAQIMAARDARFRTKLEALMAEKRGQIAVFIQYFYDRVGVEPVMPPEKMAMGFMSLAEGVKLFMMSSPTQMTPPTAEALLSLFVDSIMKLARLGADSTSGK